MPEVIEYKCPNCGAPMKYNIKNEKLSCRFCCNTYDLEYIRSHFIEVTDEKLSDFNWVDRTKYVWEPYDQDYHEEFQCPSCGGKIVTKAFYGTAVCPFCRHDVVISSDFDGDIRPDKVIPFKVTSSEFAEKYTEYVKQFRNVPEEFTGKDIFKGIIGCYIPVWRYSCLCGEGNSDPTYKQLWVKDYPILANDTDISKEVFNTLLPYEYSEAEDFTDSCLAGFYASRYIIGAENAMKTTDVEIKKIYYSQKKVKFMNNSVKKTYGNISTEKLIDKLEGFRLDTENTSYRRLSYYLVPVWLLDIIYGNEKFTFAMNGQTGQMRVDKIPGKSISKICYWLIFSVIQLLTALYIAINLKYDMIQSLFVPVLLWIFFSYYAAKGILSRLTTKKSYFRPKQFVKQKIWSVKDYIEWEHW